ncbi:MAG: hypothetical protein JOZ07_17560 [Solirubrobacterales bacterium]|nr:hypothetical protein [Solirubrobacterales bacterium]
MCPTSLGRVQTRWAILIAPAVIAAIVSAITGNAGWIVLIGVYFVLGVALDSGFYPLVIRWQPPWLTFVLAGGEFVLVFILAHVLKLGLTNLEAIALYWGAWVMAIWTKVALLPLLSLGWIENAGEFRQTGWSVAPEYMPLAVTVFEPHMGAGEAPALVRQFSSVHALPDELRNLPSPSAIRPSPLSRTG